MPIAAILNIPQSKQEIQYWAFAHMAHHRDINAAILRNYNYAMPEYLLDPMNVRDLGAWSDQHQTMHSLQDRILGISGYDLSDLNWADQGQRQGWIFLNFQEHYEAANILGVY
jgi:hypothetical protein